MNNRFPMTNGLDLSVLDKFLEKFITSAKQESVATKTVECLWSGITN